MPTDAGWIESSALPPRSALLSALRADADLPAHPVLENARALANCHERRMRALALAQNADGSVISAAVVSAAVIEDIDRERAAMVDRINAWVAAHVVHRHGASLHTETLGAVIDRVAAKWVAAQSCPPGTGREQGGPAADRVETERNQRSREPLSGTDAHLRWTRLAELADGYQVLVTEVAQNRRRLPVH